MLVNEQDVKKRFPSFPFFQLKKNYVKFTQGSRKFKFTLFWSTSNVQCRSSLSPKQVQLWFNLGLVKVQVQVHFRSRSTLGLFLDPDQVSLRSTFGLLLVSLLQLRSNLGVVQVQLKSILGPILGLVQVQYPIQVRFRSSIVHVKVHFRSRFTSGLSPHQVYF